MKHKKQKSVSEILKGIDDYNNHLEKLDKIRAERKTLNNIIKK